MRSCTQCLRPATIPLSDGYNHHVSERWLIIRQLPDVVPTPTKAYGNDNSGTRNVYIRKMDLAERIIKDLDNSGTANPSSSSGSDQHKRVRFSDQAHVDSKLEGDTEMQTGGQEASVARKRHVERLKEGSAEIAETGPDKRIALKRVAEGDPSDSEMEDSVIVHLRNSGTKRMIPTVKLVCSSFSSVIGTSKASTLNKPVCEEPQPPFPHGECGWDYIDDTSGKLLNNTLVEKARAEEISVIRELGEVVDP